MTDTANHNHEPGHCTRRAHRLLLCGAAAGISLAGVGVLRGPTVQPASPLQTQPKSNISEPLPTGAVARVNGRLISDDDFQKVLALEVSGGLAPDGATKRALLDRMIDEELRVQRAIELDLHHVDARVRMDLASAVAEAAAAAVAQETLDEAALRSYFEDRRDYFARRGPLRLRTIWVGIIGGNLGEAFNRARTASKLLREKEAFETVKEICGNSDPRPLPDRLLRPDELTLHLGRVVLDAALTLQPGEVSDPVRSNDGFHVLQVLERRDNDRVSFEGSRLDVEAEFWAERTRRALEANAAELRQTASIQKAASL